MTDATMRTVIAPGAKASGWPSFVEDAVDWCLTIGHPEAG